MTKSIDTSLLGDANSSISRREALRGLKHFALLAAGMAVGARSARGAPFGDRVPPEVDDEEVSCGSYSNETLVTDIECGTLNDEGAVITDGDCGKVDVLDGSTNIYSSDEDCNNYSPVSGTESDAACGMISSSDEKYAWRDLACGTADSKDEDCKGLFEYEGQVYRHSDDSI